jgi:hypothetical protein
MALIVALTSRVGCRFGALEALVDCVHNFRGAAGSVVSAYRSVSEPLCRTRAWSRYSIKVCVAADGRGVKVILRIAIVGTGQGGDHHGGDAGQCSIFSL